jgi:SAM-dependent methyltransferase
MKVYSELCTEVYDLTKPVGSSFGDVEYYRERLQSCTGRILEPATGSGRVLIPLLQAGLNVDGFDNSPEMLALCRTRLEDRGLETNLFEGLMEEFSLPNRYEAIIMPAGSFLLLEQREQSIRALKCFFEHLEPGGRLILDSYVPAGLELHAVRTRSFTTPQGDFITLEDKKVEIDYFNQYHVSHLKYEKWRDGKLLHTELQVFPMRWYGVEELRLVLQEVGFTDIVISADYQYGKAPTRINQTFTYEAVRP